MPSMSLKSVYFAFEEMRQNSELCDVKIEVNNLSISAHRVVLSAAIPFFRNMFTSGTKESQEKDIRIKHVDLDALESLIHYAYGKELRITAKNVKSLFLACDYLDVTDVKDECGEYMARRLDIENVLEVRNFAENVSHSSLINRCDNYLLENLNDFFQSARFFSLSFPILKDILKGIAFYRTFSQKTLKEETVFEAIISWIKASQAAYPERQDMLAQLFRNVQLERVSLEYLCERIASEELIKACDTCKNLVEEAKQMHVFSGKTPIFSRLFHRSLSDDMRQEYSRFMYSRSGMYAVCFSQNFGLYVRAYDCCGKEKWVTLIPCLPMEACFKQVVYRLEAIYVFLASRRFAAKLKLSTLEWVRSEKTTFHTALKRDDRVYLFDQDPCSSNGVLVCDGIRVANLDKDDYGCKAVKVLMPSFACFQLEVYVSGGQVEGKCVSEFERYNPKSNTWIKLPPMPTRRCGHISASLESKIYVCGGMDDSGQSLSIVEVFSVVTNQWSSVSPMRVPRSRFSLAAWKRKLYAVGGAGESETTYSVEIFDPKTKEWTNGPPIYVWDDVGKTKVRITCSVDD